MIQEQKDKILKALAEDRNNYARECQERIAEEYGKIMGADYMIQRFLDILKTEVKPQESTDKELTNGEYIEKIIEQNEHYYILKDYAVGKVIIEVPFEWWYKSRSENEEENE